MKATLRAVITCAAFVTSLALTSPPAPSWAQAAATSLKDRLVGHWQLVSVTVNGATPYGANPQGSMILDAGGHFSIIVISAGDARNIAYFGTYTVDDASKSVTMHVDGSSGGSGQSAGGRDLKRLVALNGDELTVSSDRPAGAPGGATLTWKRAN
jgi:Lipocalin-like domain